MKIRVQVLRKVFQSVKFVNVMCVFPDEYDLAYRSILPVQVVWNKKPLNIIRTVKTDMSLVRPSVMKSWQTG